MLPDGSSVPVLHPALDDLEEVPDRYAAGDPVEVLHREYEALRRAAQELDRAGAPSSRSSDVKCSIIRHQENGRSWWYHEIAQTF